MEAENEKGQLRVEMIKELLSPSAGTSGSLRGTPGAEGREQNPTNSRYITRHVLIWKL